MSRAPGALGPARRPDWSAVFGADAIALGFADRFVPHGDLDAFTQKIVTGGVKRIGTHAVEPPPVALAAQRDWIDGPAGDNVADIDAALRKQGGEPAVNASDLIASRSPIALSR
ncbi:enoyl-CoA hydratase/isomerase family protein [Mycobacterium tuberculosis]